MIVRPSTARAPPRTPRMLIVTRRRKTVRIIKTRPNDPARMGMNVPTELAMRATIPEMARWP